METSWSDIAKHSAMIILTGIAVCLVFYYISGAA
jgi:hypothetical protein